MTYCFVSYVVPLLVTLLLRKVSVRDSKVFFVRVFPKHFCSLYRSAISSPLIRSVGGSSKGIRDHACVISYALASRNGPCHKPRHREAIEPRWGYPPKPPLGWGGCAPPGPPALASSGKRPWILCVYAHGRFPYLSQLPLDLSFLVPPNLCTLS